jgi:hypothetical protein
MNTAELKRYFHYLIDSIEDETVLRNIFEIINSKATVSNQNVWKRLNKGEQEALMKALEESEYSDDAGDDDDTTKK